MVSVVVESNSFSQPHSKNRLVSANMAYTQRIATLDDVGAIAPLWQAFAEARSQVDPSMQLVYGFDYERYVAYQLAKPLFFCFVLEYEQQPVGFLSIYIYDEAPPADLPSDITFLDSPFKSRRVGAVFGLYVQEIHSKKGVGIKILIDAAMQKAESFKITDIDILVSNDQLGIHEYLEKRLGFKRSAVQLTKHYEITDKDLPNLHIRNNEVDRVNIPIPEAIPLKDLSTGETVKNAQGEIVYLEPLRDENGKVFKSSRGLPIYPTPMRDPQTQGWLFDDLGHLVFTPFARNEVGAIAEVNGIPKSMLPVYDYVDGQLILKRDEAGNYCFT